MSLLQSLVIPFVFNERFINPLLPVPKIGVRKGMRKNLNNYPTVLLYQVENVYSRDHLDKFGTNPLKLNERRQVWCLGPSNEI